MATTLEANQTTTATGWGGHSMSAPLQRVIVRQPASPQGDAQWREFAYEHPIDEAVTAAEHAALRQTLAAAGVEVIAAGPDAEGLLDAMFAFDASIMSDAGAIVLRSGKDLRLPEADLATATYEALGIPVAGRIAAPGTVDGGDTVWLDAQTLAVGRSYRTNDEGIAQLRAILAPQGVEVITTDLPHWRGPGECLHLMSFISPIAEKLAVVFLPMMPVPFVRELQARGWEFVEVPEEEFLTHGCNVLALAPRKVLVCEGSPITRGRLEAAGCEVLTYKGDELSHNRAGGPTCLTRPILRDMERAG
ncbi:MAG: arginine deiminase family protein [Thermomicrobiales bacterium]